MDLVLGPDATVPQSREHAIVGSKGNAVCVLPHMTASPKQCFPDQACGNCCLKQTVIRRQMGWKGADLDRAAWSRRGGFGCFCSIYADNGVGQNLEVV